MTNIGVKNELHQVLSLWTPLPPPPSLGCRFLTVSASFSLSRPTLRAPVGAENKVRKGGSCALWSFRVSGRSDETPVFTSTPCRRSSPPSLILAWTTFRLTPSECQEKYTTLCVRNVQRKSVFFLFVLFGFYSYFTVSSSANRSKQNCQFRTSDADRSAEMKTIGLDFLELWEFWKVSINRIMWLKMCEFWRDGDWKRGPRKRKRHAVKYLHCNKWCDEGFQH